MGIRLEARTVPRMAGRSCFHLRRLSRYFSAVVIRLLSWIGRIEYASLEISPTIRASLGPSQYFISNARSLIWPVGLFSNVTYLAS